MFVVTLLQLLQTYFFESRPPLKISTLQYFVEVATEKSFTRAANNLYISQPTLSRHIQELEAELGVTLLIRHKYSVQLSDAGEKFFTETIDVLEKLDHLTHLFDDQKDVSQSSVVIRIGVLPNFNLSPLEERLATFKATHPNVKILLTDDTPMNLADGLNNGRYDLVFCLASYFAGNQNIEKHFFMANHLQIALPQKHHLAQQPSLKFSELESETFILLERKQSPIIVDYVVNQGLINGFNLRADYYVNNLDEGLTAVSAGKGLAFLYSGMNNGNLAQQYHIKIIDLEDVNQDQNIVTVTRKTNRNALLVQLTASLKLDNSGES